MNVTELLKPIPTEEADKIDRSTLVKLTEGQHIRMESKSIVLPITIHSRIHKMIENNYNTLSMLSSIASDCANDRPFELLFSMQECAMITKDYPGKREMLAAKAAKVASAPLLKPGQIVEFEGLMFKVIYFPGSSEYANPVKFQLVRDSFANKQLEYIEKYLNLEFN